LAVANITAEDWRTTAKGKNKPQPQIGGAPPDYRRLRGKKIGGDGADEMSAAAARPAQTHYSADWNVLCRCR